MHRLSRPGDGDLHVLLGVVLDALAEGAADRGGPVPAGEPEKVAARIRAALGTILPESGQGADAIARLTRTLAVGAVDLASPAWAAHLLSPPLAVATAANVASTVLNADLTSWDQSPAGIVIEDEVVRALAELVGYDPDAAGGSITSGGTESNLVGLLLARDRHAGPGVFLASAAAHFSVRRGARILGIRPEDVVAVESGPDHRMRPEALEAALRRIVADGRRPACVTLTAGTTDLGAIDPLDECVATAHAYGASVHVDAAYGGGALFSRRLRPLLAGVEHADTVSLDLHKYGWQPIGAGVLLARRAESFAPLAVEVPYINAADDLTAGHLSHMGTSLRTTRPADAFKMAVSFQALGRSALGAMIDRCHELARHAARRISEQPRLSLAAEPVLSTVVFRYLPRDAGPDRSDHINGTLRRTLLSDGTAVIGRTELDGRPARVWLKFTLLNPTMSRRDVDDLVELVVAAGRRAESSPVPPGEGSRGGL
jgi:L-2,4-diaminobutyrate decarboxylase